MTTIHHFTKMATRVDTLPDAWAFVMAHIDTVGDAPSIEIGPVWSGPDFEDLHYEVAVSGTHDLGAAS